MKSDLKLTTCSSNEERKFDMCENVPFMNFKIPDKWPSILPCRYINELRLKTPLDLFDLASQISKRHKQKVGFAFVDSATTGLVDTVLVETTVS